MDKDTVFIAASPDGVVLCDSCPGFGLLEIKCPSSLKKEKPSQDNYEHLGADGLLKKTPQYYSQIQAEIGVAQASWCDFFVYMPTGYALDQVFPDAARWAEIKDAACFMFRKYIAPYLFAGKNIFKASSPDGKENKIVIDQGVPVNGSSSSEVTDIIILPSRPKRKTKRKQKHPPGQVIYTCPICVKPCK